MKGHRLLKEGEILQKGDFWVLKDGVNSPVVQCAGQELNYMGTPCYRPIKQAKKKKYPKRIRTTVVFSAIIRMAFINARFRPSKNAESFSDNAAKSISRIVHNNFRRRRKTS